MHSFILIGTNDSRKQYLHDFCVEKRIGKFDQIQIEPLENTLGIESIRNFQKQAYLKPRQGMEKVVILEHAETLTMDAQNALLKLLEEPPLNTSIFLSAIHERNFLPTIVSRCKIIVLENDTQEIAKDKKEELEQQVEIILNGSVGHKLALAEKITQGKEEGDHQWTVSMILFVRNRLLADTENAAYLFLLKNLQETYRYLETTQVGHRLLLEQLFLQTF